MSNIYGTIKTAQHDGRQDPVRYTNRNVISEKSQEIKDTDDSDSNTIYGSEEKNTSGP